MLNLHTKETSMEYTFFIRQLFRVEELQVYLIFVLSRAKSFFSFLGYKPILSIWFVVLFQISTYILSLAFFLLYTLISYKKVVYKKAGIKLTDFR